MSALSSAVVNKDFVKGIYHAFRSWRCRRRARVFRSGDSVGVSRQRFLCGGQPVRGPNEVFNKVFVRLATEWEDFKVEPMEFIAEGDRVVVLARETGTFPGDRLEL